MNSSSRPELILDKISKDLVDNVDSVLKCDALYRDINQYYLAGIEPFLKRHADIQNIMGLSSKQEKRIDKLKNVLKGADFYSKKAREFFSFFGIDFEIPKNSQPVDASKLNADCISPFLFDSVQLLYVILWEVFAEFLRPLEKLYQLRLCHSGLFPERYPLFPHSSGTEQMELDFLKIAERSPLFRVGETFPFELRVVCQASNYFMNCFDEGRKKTKATDSKEMIDDLIRLFAVRNNVCHIGRTIRIQEASHDRMLSLLYNLSTLLPRVQDACVGAIAAFGELANIEVSAE